MNAPACARCGQPITPGARFCTRCGSDVSGEQGMVATARLPSVPPEEAGIEILRRATLGEYEILAELGRGGMATVYLAHEISLDRKVAIKVMAPQLMFGEGMAERFRREARTAASLSHPHIIPIFAVKESGRVLYFVMKFVAGRPLDDIIREVGPLPIPMVRAILSQVGSALGYAHRRGIIHRDIKPANIMIDDEGWAVVTDFGIAKVAETQGLTMTGVAVGTPSYMSPEQCAAKEVTGRSDQYSLGVVAYEMITGKQPFVADTAMAIMWQHFNDPPQPLRTLRAECPAELEAAVLQMMEKQPDKRWSSIEDAMGALGTTPLAHDDPVRLRMVGLAQSSLNQRLLDEMKTPTSLVPPTRGSNRQATEVIAGVGSVAVSPRSVNLAAGDTLQLSVLVQNTKGDTIAGRTVQWSSANPVLASVSSSGLVSAHAPGEVAITGSCEGQSGSCQLAIAPASAAALVLAPATANLEAGDTTQMSATVRDAQGRAITGRAITWASSAPALASVSAEGLVAGSVPGIAKITATCEGRSGTATITVVAAAIATLKLNLDSVALPVGKSVLVEVSLLDRRGNAIAGGTLAWASPRPAIATVSENGLITATGAGSTEVTATCAGKTAVVKVSVSPVVVARIVLDASPRSIEIGETRKLSAAALDETGQRLDRPMTWHSSDSSILAMTPAGEITGLQEGTAEIKVAAEQQTEVLRVAVVPAPIASVAVSPANVGSRAGETTQLVAQAQDARGKVVNRPIVWSSSKPAVATVSGTGMVTAVGPGTSIITATVDGKKATADVRVAAPPVVAAVAPPLSPAEKAQTKKSEAPVVPREAPTHMMAAITVEAPAVEPARPAPPREPAEKKSRIPLVIGVFVVLAIAAGLWYFRSHTTGKPAGVAVSIATSPSSPTIKAGDSVQMSAVFRDSANTEISDPRAITWSSDNPSVAVVSGDWIRGVSGGTATILGHAGELQASAVLTVQGAIATDHVAVSSIILGSLPQRMTTSDLVQATTEVKDAGGALLPGRPVSWTSSNPSIVSVTPAGQILAKGEGTATLTATSEGKSAMVSITVAPAAVAAVQVTPSRSSLEVAGTVRLSAQARDAKGNVLDGRTVTWTSSNPPVATVAADGNVKASATGSTTMTATVDGKSGTATVTVVLTRVDVGTVTIAPNGGDLTVGDKLQLQADLKDARGAIMRDRTPEWSSTDIAIATVSPTGLVTAAGAGTATITASSDGKQASTRVTVSRTAVGSLVLVNQPPGSLPVGESFQLAAAVRDARGSPLGDRAVSWSSSNQQVATVTASGLVNAVGQGNARITAASEGKTISASISVPRPAAVVATVMLVPPTTSIVSGGTVQLSATPQDARGAAMERPITWNSSNAAVATVSRSGLVTGGNPGTTTITATSDGKTGSGAVTVTAGDVPNVVTPPPSNTGSSNTVPRGSIVAGGAFSCGLLSGGTLACWGAGNAQPTVLAADARFNRLSAGTAHACGLTAGGEAYCWGTNTKGQIGDGTTNNTRTSPVAVAGGIAFRLIRAGGKHTCALTGSGKAYCWGDNGSGQLGDGTSSGRTRPVPVPDLTFTDLSVGGSHTCGIATSGKTYCWGDGFSGQLGYGQLSTEKAPIEIDAQVRFSRIYAGGSHTCALTAQGKAYCWGDNRAAQVGDGSNSDRTRPVEVATSVTFEELSLGASHTCGRTSGGSILCWGANGKGQLGDGTRGNRARPVRLPGDGFLSISAGGAHTCAATATEAFCWGENARGQLGDGSLIAKPAPTSVLGSGS
ncbi:MAG: Ig-like domain-containing protein [Gemmatimonadota bacterium]